MPASDNARLAIDSNFDINGVDAVYYSAYPGAGKPCRILPAQADVEFGLEMARVQVAKSQFMLRSYLENIVPVKGGVLETAGITYRLEENPSPDDLRLLWRLNCVKR